MTSKRLRLTWKIALAAAAVVIAGCLGYASRIRDARNYFEYQEFDLAEAELRPLVERKDNDLLLYLMDLGLVYHTAGRYEEAIKVFLDADKLAEINDYTSLTAEVGTVFVNDDVQAYKGENFEKVLINMYLAIDYTMLGRYDDALVECRRVNRKLERMIKEGGLPYEQNTFAKYLAAALFEARGEYNDAMVDYRQLLRWRGEFPFLGEPLLRIADRMKFSQELMQFKKRFPEVGDYQLEKGEGEIVLLLEQGKAPIKVPSEQFRLVPVFVKNYYSSDFVYLRASAAKDRVRSYPLFSIESAAIAELDHKLGLIIAKKVGGTVAKEILAYTIAERTKSQELGQLVRLLFYFSDKADLRSWTTLPAKLHIARLKVPAGRHEVALDMVTVSGQEIRGEKIWRDVEVKPGQMVFLNYRTRD